MGGSTISCAAARFSARVLTPVMLAAPKVYSRRFGWLRDHTVGRPMTGRRKGPMVIGDDFPKAAE